MEQLDLADLKSVDKLCEKMRTEPVIDGVILNAGIMASPLDYTKDGFESQVGTNHFGHFHLVTLLLEKLQHQVSLDALHLSCPFASSTVVQ